MNRELAKQHVMQYTEQYEQYLVVSKVDAQNILLDRAFKTIQTDKIKGRGPSGYDGFYYWNVIDYLENPDLQPYSCLKKPIT